MSKIGQVFSKGKKVAQFLTEYAQDMWTYLKFNNYSPFVENNKRLFYRALIETHTIEKGLALGETRLMFGKEKIKGVARILSRYDPTRSRLPPAMASGAMADYARYNREHGATDDFIDFVEREAEKLLPQADPARMGGYKWVGPLGSAGDYARLLTTRTSCRMYAPRRLPLDLVQQIVSLAQTAPSQCNRQATHAHFYQKPAQIAELLRLQAGSAGFAHTVQNLFVITSDVAAWGGAQQRNQLYVDGALFSMCLMLACHALGLVSCPLNLAVTNATERAIRRAGDIPDGQRTIMMIAVGYPAGEQNKAAKSPRRDTTEIFSFHGE